MQEADPVRGICDAHGGYETAEVRDVRITGGGAGCVGDQENFSLSLSLSLSLSPSPYLCIQYISIFV